MALTAKQQRNVEALIDQHFAEVQWDLQGKINNIPTFQVERTPELEQLAVTHAKVLELQDRQLVDALKLYNTALESLGLPPQPVPYRLSGDAETTERRADHLVRQVIRAEQDRLYNAERARLNAAWEAMQRAKQQARRKVLLASLDGSEALVLIEGLPDLDTLLATTTTEETPA